MVLKNFFFTYVLRILKRNLELMLFEVKKKKNKIKKFKKSLKKKEKKKKTKFLKIL